MCGILKTVLAFKRALGDNDIRKPQKFSYKQPFSVCSRFSIVKDLAWLKTGPQFTGDTYKYFLFS